MACGNDRMSLDLGVLDYVREQISLVEPVVVRRMFGGAGIYARGVFFALLAEDAVYLKTDDSNRADYLSLRCTAFRPWGDDGPTLDYHEAPETVIDDVERLRIWMEKSIVVALRAKEKKKPITKRASQRVVKRGGIKKQRKGAANKKTKKASRKTK